MSSAPVLEDGVYNAIIVGTGLPESVLSAALSIAGKRVLHLDPNSFYGSQHASRQLRRLHNIALESGVPLAPSEFRDAIEEEPAASLIPAVLGREATKVAINLRPASKFEFPRGARTFAKDEGQLPGNVTIDLVPRCLLAAGSLVDLLVQTGAGHYVSFRPLDAAFLWFSTKVHSGCSSGKLERVPASRSDVFQSHALSIVEKRLLMRFLSLAAPNDPITEATQDTDHSASLSPLHTTFEDQMQSARLTEKLREFLRHAIVFSGQYCGMQSDSREALSAQDGLDAVRKYLRSVVRFGTSTPFLYPNYGSGELCEALCRLSAVNGGTFALRRGIQALFGNCGAEDAGPSYETPKERQSARCALVTSDGECLRADFIFLSSALISRAVRPSLSAESAKSIWRFAGLLDGSAFDELAPRATAVFPMNTCGNPNSSIRVFQMDSSAHICPEGMYVLYAETLDSDGTELDLISTLRSLIDFEVEENSMSEILTPRDDKERSCPRVLWYLIYPQEYPASVVHESSAENMIPPGLCIVKDSPYESDGNEILEESRRCFRMICPSQDFFPAATSVRALAGNRVSEV